MYIIIVQCRLLSMTLATTPGSRCACADTAYIALVILGGTEVLSSEPAHWISGRQLPYTANDRFKHQ